MPNHLYSEKSPYLLQHSENPVDWYPWSDQAFLKAQSEGKPVFLSIGYSTCHWCHMMAHESFEDKEIARILNTHFVPVKVDREERPEIDMVYMSVCQAMTGRGGWPLTIIMTPDKKPFFAGTYLPPRSRYGMTGLTELLEKVSGLWETDREQLLQMSRQVMSLIHGREGNGADGMGTAGDGMDGTGTAGDRTEDSVSWELAHEGFKELSAMFDKKHGGFGRAPKFPAPHNLLFLMMYYAARDEDHAMDMVEQTLTAMARGGIHDQIGGGFSRYSTDEAWLVPHFEKMLYDNALLALSYLEGYRLTDNPYYRQIAERILLYVERELSDSDGGFYCGQDADSEGVEGKFYVFSKDEIRQILDTPREYDDFCQWFGITEKGNFEGKNIPNLLHNPGYKDTFPFMGPVCKKVYDHRIKRMALHRDDKILTSWNSMMITAYAKAGLLLDQKAYEKKARNAQMFVEQHLVDENHRMFVRYRDGERAFPGNLDDYAYYCLGLLALYEATLEVDYLELALKRAAQMADLFWDSRQGGFYFYGRDVQELIHRPKEIYDGAVPSGNSAAAHVLLALASLTAEPRWQEFADRQLSFLAAGAKGYPSAHCFSLMAFMKALSISRELVCVSADNKAPDELFDYMRRQKKTPISILFKCPGNEDRLSRIAPFTNAYPIPGQGVLYYLCENHTCGVPASTLPVS